MRRVYPGGRCIDQYSRVCIPTRVPGGIYQVYYTYHGLQVVLYPPWSSGTHPPWYTDYIPTMVHGLHTHPGRYNTPRDTHQGGIPHLGIPTTVHTRDTHHCTHPGYPPLYTPGIPTTVHIWVHTTLWYTLDTPPYGTLRVYLRVYDSLCVSPITRFTVGEQPYPPALITRINLSKPSRLVYSRITS